MNVGGCEKVDRNGGSEPGESDSKLTEKELMQDRCVWMRKEREDKHIINGKCYNTSNLLLPVMLIRGKDFDNDGKGKT